MTDRSQPMILNSLTADVVVALTVSAAAFLAFLWTISQPSRR